MSVGGLPRPRSRSRGLVRPAARARAPSPSRPEPRRAAPRAPIVEAGGGWRRREAEGEEDGRGPQSPSRTPLPRARGKGGRAQSPVGGAEGHAARARKVGNLPVALELLWRCRPMMFSRPLCASFGNRSARLSGVLFAHLPALCSPAAADVAAARVTFPARPGSRPPLSSRRFVSRRPAAPSGAMADPPAKARSAVRTFGAPGRARDPARRSAQRTKEWGSATCPPAVARREGRGEGSGGRKRRRAAAAAGACRGLPRPNGSKRHGTHRFG